MTHQKIDYFKPADYSRVSADFQKQAGFRETHSTPSFFPPSYDRDVRVLIAQASIDNPVNDNREADMNSKSLTKLEFWIGILCTLVGVFAIAIGATWTISNTINEKVGSSRQELTGNIQTSRTEITTRIDRLEDKMDVNYKDTSSSLMKIQAILEAKQTNNK